jgi:O-antigen ligase
MIFGIFFYWYFWTLRNGVKSVRRTVDMLISLLFVLMILWLLEMADSATSLSALALGVVTVTLLGLPFLNRRRIAAYVAIGLALTVCVQLLFDPYTQIVEWLGRDPNLTDRTEVWADAVALQPNVLLGAGFESFWLGSRLEVLWSKWWWRPNQAHNGYIETYLNLGLVGLFLLSGLLISTLLKISHSMVSNFDWGRLRLALFLAILAFNYTEAGFKGVHFVWTVFYIIALEYAGKSGSPRQADNSKSPVASNSQKKVRRFLKQGS